MATGRETLQTILDARTAFTSTHGHEPTTMRLPVLMAWDLAKCGYQELGDLSVQMLQEGIDVLEDVGFDGMNVEIVRAVGRALDFA